MIGWLLAGVLAMGPQWYAMGPWSPVDLPYPDISTSESIGGQSHAPEAQVNESIAAWAKRTAPGRKVEVNEVRIEGPRATARVDAADRAYVLKLERVGEEWRVLEK